MYYVSEKAARDLVRQSAVTEVVSNSFAALAREEAACFPIVREDIKYADATFGVKSGFDRSAPPLGIKAGGYWPENINKGYSNHQSTILLFDEDSGAPSALVRATYLTLLRTAAASALSIRHLARYDSTTLGIVGAGGQGVFQLCAAVNERPFDTALIFDPNKDNESRLINAAKQMGLDAKSVTPEDLCAAADVIITITPSRRAIIQDHWIKEGVHLACVGADTIGKQEVEPALAQRARLFGDIAGQAVTIGERQHAFNAGLISKEAITTLGLVIDGRSLRRENDDDITMFDSTGVALQDLAAARLGLDAAREAGRAIELD